MVASTSTTGVAHWLASGNSPRQNRIIPKVPILSMTPTIMVAPPGLDSSAASGSQVCSGTSGALMAKANMKPRNSQRPVPVAEVQLAQVLTAGSSARRPGPTHVQPDHRGQHDEAAEQAEDQELRRRVRATRPGPKPPIRKYIGIRMTSKNT